MGRGRRAGMMNDESEGARGALSATGGIYSGVMRRLIVMLAGMWCCAGVATADIVDEVMTGALSGETLSVRIEALREGMDGEDQRAHLAMGVLLKARAVEVFAQMVRRHGLHG